MTQSSLSTRLSGPVRPAHHPSYLRNPHPHGDLVVFTAEDDVWVAPLDGGRAWRVSADNMPVRRPRISPDGVSVAWTSTRDGAPEVHVADLAGGPSRRLTYWGNPLTSVRTWTPGGELVVVTAAGEASIRRTWAHRLPLDGGPSTRLPLGPVGDLAHGPDGALLLQSVTMGREAAYWKGYRGGTAGKLWLDPDGGGEFARLHEGVDGNIECPMWVGDRIAFLSDHEGQGALYSSRPDGADLRRHTPLGGFYARQAATDGTRVVYTAGGTLHLLDGLGEDVRPRPLEIGLGGQRADLQPLPVRPAAYLGDARPDHTGRGSAVEVRGTTHWVTHRGGPARVLSARPGVRTRHPRVFSQGEDQYVVWVTDADGDDALEIAPATGLPAGTAPRRLAAGRLGRVHEIEVSPDGHRIAVASHDGRVLLVDTQTGEVREVPTAGGSAADGDPSPAPEPARNNADASDLAFSPDSGWLAWSQPGPGSLRQIKLASTADLTLVEATPLRFIDYAPAFTADGRHLAFLSERAFDPVYDAHVFDLSFPNACRPYLLTLTATTPSPFGPQRHGRPYDDEADDDGHGDGAGTDAATDSGADAGPDGEGEGAGGNADGGGPGRSGHRDRPRATKVDAEGIADRIVPFPVEAGHYSGLRAAKGAVLWLRHPLTGTLGAALATPEAEPPESVLERYDLRRLKVDEIASDAEGFAVSGDGTKVLVSSGSRLRVGPADSKSDEDSDSSVGVDLSRVRVTIGPADEWRQMFDETHRLARDHFWRPDMGGLDWDGIGERYRALLDKVATHDDLVDLLWELHGELRTSHAYVTPAGASHDPRRRQGLLGADLSRSEDGAWRVDRVLPGESSDPRARSPLAAPGVAVRAGDVLVAVDGVPVDPLAGPAPLLVGTAGKPVELTVEPAAGGPVRHVVAVPLADEEALRYHDWVADRRAHVHRASGGRLGYLHVPDMVSSGWAELHRDLRVEMARDGLVVDVRENRGGHTSQLVVEKLARRVIGWDLPRHGHPFSYPQDAPRGPVVAVANEFSGSDGDIVNAAIRTLGIGPVVGTRTWGGVIGIDSRYQLVDGTGVTQPKYALWFEGFGWSVENHGVDPDVEVVVTPQDHAAGRDPQLDRAVEMALEALAAHPPKSPPTDLPS
ncbi:putative protease [Actinacidiphila reveromycinica]|uniref:Tricorn protease homolog n=1 Tax=Actinacidiphila reveromycinica TaxID=659352 RepID=A0A7U3VN63_9ACTN|nr:S41 family peptidase [Streptomyces sp. SN-593]BBA97348.1 putative protease [Streptomyces sp. SN-593]